MIRAFVNRRPNSPQAMLEAAYLSAYMLNDLPAADRFREQARRLALNPQPSEVLTPALKAFRNGDMVEVVAQLKQSSNRRIPRRTCSGWSPAPASGRGRIPVRHARLAESGYRTPDAIVGVVANSCWSAQIRNELTAALRNAFATIPARAL